MSTTWTFRLHSRHDSVFSFSFVSCSSFLSYYFHVYFFEWNKEHEQKNRLIKHEKRNQRRKCSNTTGKDLKKYIQKVIFLQIITNKRENEF